MAYTHVIAHHENVNNNNNTKFISTVITNIYRFTLPLIYFKIYILFHELSDSCFTTLYLSYKFLNSVPIHICQMYEKSMCRD